MKFSCLAFATIVLGLAATPSLAFEAYQKPAVGQTGVPALALRAIQAATPEMRKLKPDWRNYEVQAAETGNSLIVSFWQSNTAPVAQGGGPAAEKDGTASMVNFIVVELDKQTLKVTGVHQLHV